MQLLEDFYKHEMSRLATQYYASARLAVANRLLGVFGNLYHHAFEMILKSTISKVVTAKEMKRFRHNIPELWEVFSEHYQVSKSEYENSARVVHAFEGLRYPEKFLEDSLELSVVGMGVSATEQTFGVKRGFRLVVNVDHLEEWWLDIHAACGLNPLFEHSSWPKTLQDSYLSETAGARWAGLDQSFNA